MDLFVVFFRNDKDGMTSIQCCPNLRRFQFKKLGEVVDGKWISKVHQASYDGIKPANVMVGLVSVMLGQASIRNDLGVKWVNPIMAL